MSVIDAPVPAAPAPEAPDLDAPAPLRFERRREDRWPVDGQASAFRLAGDRFGEIHELRVTDFAEGGVGATCDDVIEPGTLLTLGFDMPGCVARRGTVVRCVPTGDGYRVGIRLELALAA